jgi:glycogen(starch) synthase
MKILMLGWELPPHNSGGLGTACYQLCKALSQKDVDIEFVVPYQADHGIDFMNVSAASPQDVEMVIRAGIAYDSAQYIFKNGQSEWLNIYQQQALYEASVPALVEGREFDVVHAHDWLTFRAALRIKEMKNWPIILHVHSVESDRAGHYGGNPLVSEIEALSLNLADKIIAVSDRTKQAIIRDYGVPADKIEIIHNSIEPAEIVPLSGDNSYKYLSLMKSLGYKVVSSVGRLTIQKGLPNLLQAAKHVIDKNPKTLFLIVGSGEQYYELVEMAAGLGIGANVLFTDFQRGKRWRDAFAIADLFVMPSVSEPFGLTPLEAISYGSPVLVSKQSGVGEVLRNCLKVDFWDVNELANQITAVVQNDVLAAELIKNARQEYEKLSWQKASDTMVSIYNQQLGVPA